MFGPIELILTLGQDGLVVNTAKYMNGQPIFAVNPDPARFDGVLMPFQVVRSKSCSRKHTRRHGVYLRIPYA